MQTSRFQIVLSTGLSVALGCTLTALVGGGEAVGYPAGPAVSLGSNPVVSVSNTLDGAGSELALTAPGDQALIITDVVLTMNDTGSQCRGNVRVILNAGETELARFGLGMTNETRAYTSWEPTLVASLQSGLLVDPGAELYVSTSVPYVDNCSSGTFDVNYTLSGYYAQP